MIAEHPFQTSEQRRDAAGTSAIRRTAVVCEGVEARSDSTAEIDVLGENAGVDDVHADPGSRSIAQIGTVQGERALINSIESPGRGRIRNSRILFHERHALVSSETLCVGGA